MNDNSETKTLGKVIHIDEAQIQDHLGELVRGTVEETLNAMPDAEADAMCGAQRYERSPDRIDTRAGHYNRKFHSKAGEVDPQDAQAAPADFRDRHH
jgi:putative transposase